MVTTSPKDNREGEMSANAKDGVNAIGHSNNDLSNQDDKGKIMDLARQKVDNAIGLIKREVEIQREKSNSMCRLRTAHNWTEDKEHFKGDANGDPNDLSFFMKAHTVTVLIFLICCLVYVGVIEDPIEDNTSYNSRRGLTAALFFWVAAGMTIMPDGPFIRPHPAFWRFCFAVSIGKTKIPHIKNYVASKNHGIHSISMYIEVTFFICSLRASPHICVISICKRCQKAFKVLGRKLG